MILPIIGYGDPVLKRNAKEISASYPNLKELIGNMYETMYNASGVGLAAPQVGESIRLFIIDTSPFLDMDDEKIQDLQVSRVKEVFINPAIVDETGESWLFEEGCLSIPNIRENIRRKPDVYIEYFFT